MSTTATGFDSSVAREALKAGEGLVRLAPCWVPRSFLMPGGRLKLDPRDLYALGAHRGGIDERWFSSTTNAANGPGTPEDEGLSYIDHDGKRVLLKAAIENDGDRFLGSDVMSKYGGFNLLCKFFDNLGPIPHHMHQSDEFAKKVGQNGKPEAYYFPPQLNFKSNNFPYTFMGLEPGTTLDDVRKCLERWNEGDNGILDHTRAYRLKPGTGWQIDAGILHAPGSLVTYEPQVNSDVFAMFQSMVEGRAVPWDLLVKDVPAEHHQDLDFILSMLDWDKNVDPEFGKNNMRFPTPVRDENEMGEAGYSEKWIVYGTDYYSAKELTVLPGRSVVIKDAAAYGLIVVEGVGQIGKMDVETPTLIRFGQMTKDELFVTAGAAANGVKITNSSSVQPLVMLKHFGPGNPDAAHLVRQ
ncbi:MAG TPA: hypothetical protein VES20_00545 [Bryobacteraceae bacterium]|nr:hypothetical protein [Bryobacteraceae bacterium]